VPLEGGGVASGDVAAVDAAREAAGGAAVEDRSFLVGPARAIGGVPRVLSAALAVGLVAGARVVRQPVQDGRAVQ
jgi:hypothetical protein